MSYYIFNSDAKMVPSNSPQVLFLELELSRTWNTMKFMETAKKNNS